ncbi:hypothetical protein [Streptomyces sp. CC53]|uniref:hypothetical protein n=1 Tax=Streptomyces sp. CC53 TaxID=1906740 RepID=UPI00115F7A0F|nr:hypothetical protein [Streptomyces sp. CC53]
MADLVGILQLLGAGSVGAVVTQYVGAGPERRQARAAVRSAMTELDEAVWSQGETDEWPRLRKGLHAFESAAMVAGVRREVSDWYVTTRIAFFYESRRSYEQHPDTDFGGGIVSRYVRGLNEANYVVYQALWHPQRSRFLWRRRLKAAKTAARTAAADSPSLLRRLDESERPL